MKATLTILDPEGNPYEGLENIELDDDVYEKILRISKEENITPEQIIKAALEYSVEEEKKEREEAKK